MFNFTTDILNDYVIKLCNIIEDESKGVSKIIISPTLLTVIKFTSNSAFSINNNVPNVSEELMLVGSIKNIPIYVNCYWSDKKTTEIVTLNGIEELPFNAFSLFF